MPRSLDRIYTNSWSQLPVGRCRYGLMLGEDGMVFDDGVTTRLSERHYLMSTTSGGAARVLAWLEEWLQTEWPDLKVFCTSVTEQWATIAISGPDSRRLLAELAPDIDVSREAFPHMSMREGRVCGVPARVFRISFTGELGFEIQVPASFGLGSGRRASRPEPDTRSRPTAPRRCTCCAPRRATSSPARTLTAP